MLHGTSPFDSDRFIAYTHVSKTATTSEVTPIITPALDPTFRTSRVILLSSHHISDQVTDIKQSLDSLKIGVDVHQLTDEWLPAELEAMLDSIIKKHASSAVILNVSSGTTPMCIRAAQHFIKLNLPVYYVNPENDHVCWIHPHDRSNFELQERLDLKHYFIAHGIDKISIKTELIPDVPESHVQIASLFAKLARSNSQALNQLNIHAGAATASKSRRTYSVNYPLNSRFSRAKIDCVVNPLLEHGLAKLDDNKLIFSSLEAKEFACGGWLEVYTQSQLENLKKSNPMIRDIQRGVTIRKVVGTEELTHEIDVALLADNRLYMIECKTGGVMLNMGKVLEKLDTLRTFINDDRAGAMAVSLNEVTSNIQNRADDYNIRLCTGRRLTDLCAILNYWIRKGHD